VSAWDVSAEAVALDFATRSAPVTFTGGNSYDVYGIIDADDSFDGADFDTLITTGDQVTDTPKTVTVDGNMLASLIHPDDFVTVP
jgi:hypothetical protein